VSESTAKIYQVARVLSVFSNETDELVADYRVLLKIKAVA
jgi:hypothetical protein